MKRKMFFVIFLIVLIIPIFVSADVLSTYGEAVSKANTYINSFKDRRKYLLFNKNYVYEKEGFGNSSSFKTGGLLSKGEFDLSIYLNQSYLANGKEYWTLTSDGSNKYYVDAYLQSKSTSSNSGTRVTEYIKPSTIIGGKGTYTNPWVFEEGYQIDIISNNTSYGRVSPSTPQYVKPGTRVTYTLTPTTGYFYNSRKDDCGLVKDGASNNSYVIESANRDITCTVVFELQAYKFDLLVNSSIKDYNNISKLYKTSPNPTPIYYKYNTNWYKDQTAKNVITSITPPTMDGWTFEGYYYSTIKIIDSSGNILTHNLSLGSQSDFATVNHVLYGNFTRNSYTIDYVLNGGNYGSLHPTSATYDQVVTIDNPTKTGYTFTGWSFDGNPSTAKTGNNSTSVSTSFTSSTKTTDKYFANLTPTQGAKVTLTANWRPNTYTIAFNKNNNSATGTMSGLSMTYGIAKNLLANGFSLDGYTFNGWNTNTDGSGTYYKNQASVNNLTTTSNGTVNLYARWCQNCATVSNGSCTLNATTPGTCTYTTSCNSGYHISSGEGTRSPSCEQDESHYWGCVRDKNVCCPKNGVGTCWGVDWTACPHYGYYCQY